MKRLIYLFCLVVLIFVGCEKTYDLDGLSLGQDKGDVMAHLYDKAKITSEYDNQTSMEGSIPLFGTAWHDARFKFENDKLVELSVWRPFSTTPDYVISRVKEIMREKCGGAYSDFKKGIVVYGSDEEKDCQGSIMVSLDEDIIFVRIKIID